MDEIRETEAAADTAAIYAEIRAATGLPFVNLLWRHMAALPGVLPWVWGIVGDAYRSGAVAQAALRLRGAAPDLGLAPLRPDDLSAAGLDDDDQRTLRDLVEAYNRGNAQNLIGWTALLHQLSGKAMAAQDELPADGTPPDALPPVPPIPRFDHLDTSTRALVDRLAERHKAFPPGARPSLYVHLATWPGLLDAVDARLGPALDGVGLHGASADLVARATDEAHRLTPHLATATTQPAAAERARITTALEAFTGGGVPDMIVVGTAISRALTLA
ncbi:MAG: hypothetical protein RIM84_05305 [Alphaproteobacteria bacterium]